MNGLAWLNDLMVWLARWVPRLTMIKRGYLGVMFGRGGAVRPVYPGLCFYWPITNELTVVSTRLRTTEVAAQLHGSEAISLVVRFAINDPVKMLVVTHDVFSMLDDRTQAHLTNAYRTFKDHDAICGFVEEQLRADMVAFGVEVESVGIAQRGGVLAVKLLQDYAQHSQPQLADEKVEQ